MNEHRGLCLVTPVVCGSYEAVCGIRFFQDFKTFPGLVPQTFLALSVRVTVPNQEGCKGFLGHIGLYGDMRGVVCVCVCLGSK